MWSVNNQVLIGCVRAENVPLHLQTPQVEAYLQKCSVEQKNVVFYRQWYKLRLDAISMFHQKIQIQSLTKNLLAMVQKVENQITKMKLQQNETNYRKASRQKRFRRKNSTIQKLFECRHERCFRTYATEGSLQQHTKIKHGGQRKDDKIVTQISLQLAHQAQYINEEINEGVNGSSQSDGSSEIQSQHQDKQNNINQGTLLVCQPVSLLKIQY